MTDTQLDLVKSQMDSAGFTRLAHVVRARKGGDQFVLVFHDGVEPALVQAKIAPLGYEWRQAGDGHKPPLRHVIEATGIKAVSEDTQQLDATQPLETLPETGQEGNDTELIPTLPPGIDVVEGAVITARAIDLMEKLMAAEPRAPNFHTARGVLPWQPGDEPAEESIQRMRDRGLIPCTHPATFTANGITQCRVCGVEVSNGNGHEDVAKLKADNAALLDRVMQLEQALELSHRQFDAAIAQRDEAPERAADYASSHDLVIEDAWDIEPMPETCKQRRAEGWVPVHRQFVLDGKSAIVPCIFWQRWLDATPAPDVEEGAEQDVNAIEDKRLSNVEAFEALAELVGEYIMDEPPADPQPLPAIIAHEASGEDAPKVEQDTSCEPVQFTPLTPAELERQKSGGGLVVSPFQKREWAIGKARAAGQKVEG